MRRRMITIALVTIAAWSLATGVAQAVGLAVTPREIYLEGRVGEAAAARLAIKNTSNSVALFDAYPDDLRSMVDISPASFILEGGESREIIVTMDAQAAGRFETMISIIANPISPEAFRAGAGIKVPLRAAFLAGQKDLLASIGDLLGAGALPAGAGVAALALFVRFFKITPRRRRDGM